MRGRRALLGASLFLGGLTVGAFAMDWLAMKMRPTEYWALTLTMQMEQEAQARRAARNGQLVKSLVHRWNAVALEADDGAELVGGWSEAYDERFQPIMLAVLEWDLERKHSADERRRASAVNEALLRSRLASTLEGLGFTQLATEESDRAAALHRSCECEPWQPQMLSELIEEESREPYLAAERYLLDGDAVH